MAPVITKAWKCKKNQKQDFSHQAQDKYASRLVLCFNGPARVGACWWETSEMLARGHNIPERCYGIA